MNIKYTFTVSLLCIIALFSAAQNKYIAKGDKQMKNFRFEKAAELYKKAADKNIGDTLALQKLAKTFELMEDYNSAEAVYKTLTINPISNPINYYYLAQVLGRSSKYAEADSNYKKFAAAVPTDSRAAEFKNFAQNIPPLTTDIHIYELTSIPENSNASDIGPSYWNGNLAFSSNRNLGQVVKKVDFVSGNGYYDLYTLPSTPVGEIAILEKAKGKANGKFNDGPGTYTSDGLEMIFTRSNYKKKASDGYRKLGLYHATWDAKKGWINTTPLPFIDYNYNMAHPTLSKDGNKLYFISDMLGSLGETDIYRSIRNGSTWETPVNLGKEINTVGSEMFPYIAADGTLYFATDTRVGLGGFDIFYSAPIGNKWAAPQNIGAPVNTNFDDFGYIIDETNKTGFLVSNKMGELTDDDIYKFTKKAEPLCGSVVDAKTKKTISGASLSASNWEGLSSSVLSNAKGDFCLNLAPGKEYDIETSKEGYANYTGKLTAKAFNNKPEIIELEPIGEVELLVDVTDSTGSKIEGAVAFLINKKTGEITEHKSDSSGKVKFNLFKDEEYDLKITKKTGTANGLYDKFIKTISTMGFTQAQALNDTALLTYYDKNVVLDLPNVYFDLNSYAVNPSAAKELTKVAELMRKFPEMEVELSANTDARGNATFNLTLSAYRANACVNYLADKGVDKTKLIAIGYGELYIKNKCKERVFCTEAEHGINRRTEFKVIKFD